MEWTLLNNRKRKFNIYKYRIDWKREAPSKLAQAFKDFIFEHYGSYVWLEEVRLPNTLLRVDFIDLTRNIAFEISGNQHLEYTKFFHKSRSGWLKHLQRDGEKYKLLRLNGFKVVELFENDIKSLSYDFIEKAIISQNEV